MDGWMDGWLDASVYENNRESGLLPFAIRAIRRAKRCEWSIYVRV